MCGGEGTVSPGRENGDVSDEIGGPEGTRADAPAPFDGLLLAVSYAVVPNAELYVAVMEAAVDARDRFRLQLRPSDIAAELNIDRDPAAGALDYLADHGALHRTYDASEAETLNEFYKGAFLYQVTPVGMAAHRGVREMLATRIATTGRLSASLLPRIYEQLSAVALDAHTGDDAGLAANFTSLFAVVEELADSAATYLRELDAEVADLAADGDRLAAYKAAVLAYLERFNRELNRWAPQIVEKLAEIEPHIDDMILRAAIIDAAPRPDGTVDESPLDPLIERWDGTVGWFRSRPGRTATADHVSAAMIAAINRVLGAISRLHERRMRRVSREADFTALAGWFANSDPAEAHALWDAATGMWGARHFTDFAGDEEIDRRLSFWDAGRAELAPRVRTSTKRGSTGRPGRRADYAEAKRAARQQAQAAAAQAAAARQRLARQTPARMSDLAVLDEGEFAALLEVLAATLAEHADDGHRRAVLPGATLRLRPAGDTGTATVLTRGGTLTCPNDIIEIELTGSRTLHEAVS
jgi:uncharacterized protein (TIGR02677 family)